MSDASSGTISGADGDGAGGATPMIVAVRQSHDRLGEVVAAMDQGTLEGPSPCDGWTVAQVLSHLGSQAEIFSMFLDAGLSGAPVPGPEAFGPIWARWDALAPMEQVRGSLDANGSFVARLEAIGAAPLDGLAMPLFGRTVDGETLLRMRLSEHAVHSWDVAAAADPGAEIAPEAVRPLLEGIPVVAGRVGKAPAEPADATVTTTSPERRYSLRTAEAVTLAPVEDTGTPVGRWIELPAEAMLRAVYGRLDAAHPAHGPVVTGGMELEELTALFPGF